MEESELIGKQTNKNQKPSNSHWGNEGRILLEWVGICVQVCNSSITFSLLSIQFTFILFYCFAPAIYLNSLPNNSLDLASSRADILIIDMPVLMENFSHLDSSRTLWLWGVQSTAENHTFLKIYSFRWLMITLLNLTVARSLSNEMKHSSKLQGLERTARQRCHHHWDAGCLRKGGSKLSNLYSNKLELIVNSSV